MELISERYPGIKLFDEEDEHSTGRLFSRRPLHLGHLELTYDRSPHFQGLLHAQGDDPITWILKQKDDVVGCGSHTISKRWVAGELNYVSYLSDLRVIPSRAASQTWRSFYPDMLAHLEGEAGVRWHLTAILQSNVRSRGALVERTEGFQYHLLNELEMVNSFGRLRPRFEPGKVRQVRESEKERLIEFLRDRARERLFGYDFPDEFARREAAWPGFAVENFLVFDDRDRWRGVCLPWSPTPLKRMVVTKAPRVMAWSLAALSLAGRNPPRVGEPLETLYLTHLYWDLNIHGGDLAAAFCDELQYRGAYKRNHVISFGSYGRPWRQRPSVSGLIKQVTPVSVYLVTSGKSGPPQLPYTHGELDFEMGLV